MENSPPPVAGKTDRLLLTLDTAQVVTQETLQIGPRENQYGDASLR